MLKYAGAYVCVCVCVCARMYALRIVSMNKILHFTNTLIILLILNSYIPCKMMWVTHNASIGGEVRGTEDFVNQLQVREAPVLDVGELRHLRHCHQALVIHIMVQPHHLADKVLAGEFSCK